MDLIMVMMEIIFQNTARKNKEKISLDTQISHVHVYIKSKDAQGT